MVQKPTNVTLTKVEVNSTVDKNKSNKPQEVVEAVPALKEYKGVATNSKP